MTSRRILLTGAAGRIGQLLRTGLPAAGWVLRCFDVAELGEVAAGGADLGGIDPGHAGAGEELIQGDVTDFDAVLAASTGVEAVVHLGGLAGEASYEDIRRVNIDGTFHVLEAARQSGVTRVVFASSNHAVGFTPRADCVGVDTRPRPDTFYGVSKVAGEALGSLYVDRYGMSVVCLRIGTQRSRPIQPRHLSTWLSDGDMVRLAGAALTAPDPGFAVVYGISANTRGWWDLAPGRALGYHPVDDAEAYASEVGDGSDPFHGVLGGEFTGPEFDIGAVG